MIKGSIQEDTTLSNIYAIGAPKYIKQIIGDFNTPHSSMDRSDRKQNTHSYQAHMELFSKIDHMLGQKKKVYVNLR